MLVEMDGIGSDDNVIVLAATNRPDVLDPALLRPGRFDRRIVVDLPDIKGRAAILKVHCKSVKISPDVDLSVVARGTPTFSGADLANIVNEAALIAAMRGREAVDMECFEEARDKVRWGKAKHSRQMSEEDKRATAFHEAGHALLMRLLPHVSPLHKVSIIPRGMALGATMQLPEKDEYSMGKRRILGEITVRFGGRVAEELFLDDITSGAANDFEQATNLVRSMVCEWGMSDELGPVKYSDRNGSGGYETNFFEGREFSEATAEKIDEEVRRIVDDCYSEALELLKRHEPDVRLLVDALMEYETLGREEVDLLLKERELEAVAEHRRGIREAREERLRTEGAGVRSEERTLEHEGRDMHPPLPPEERDAPPR
jgi:cell division protease FtsH